MSEVHALYEGSDEPDLVGYFPPWVNNLAEDATVEGSLIEGVVQGRDAVRTVVLAIRSFYDRQEHKFAGQITDKFFLEEYIALVRGQPIGCVVLVTRNAAGQFDHVIAGYRPLSTSLLLSRLLREKFAGTPLEEHFASATIH
jgi:hypothetical protein